MVMDLLTQKAMCNTSSEEMAQPLQNRGWSQPRTLEGLQVDAKLYQSVITPHLFDTPLSQVSVKEQRRASYIILVAIPSLHVSLGVFMTVHEMLVFQYYNHMMDCSRYCAIRTGKQNHCTYGNEDGTV